VGDFIANILADAEGNEGKGGGEDEVENKFNPVVDGEESDFLDVILCKKTNKGMVSSPVQSFDIEGKK
jgi:hypothetical protein